MCVWVRVRSLRTVAYVCGRLLAVPLLRAASRGRMCDRAPARVLQCHAVWLPAGGSSWLSLSLTPCRARRSQPFSARVALVVRARGPRRESSAMLCVRFPRLVGSRRARSTAPVRSAYALLSSSVSVLRWWSGSVAVACACCSTGAAGVGVGGRALWRGALLSELLLSGPRVGVALCVVLEAWW